MMSNSVKQTKQYSVDIISAYKDQDDYIYKITLATTPPALMPLAEYLSLVIKHKGEFRSLGICYNPVIGIETEVMSLYIRVPLHTGFEDDIREHIKKAIGDNNDRETNKKTAEKRS